MTTPSLLDRTSVVLVEPQHPLNVGSALRASRNMGIVDLRLVEPCTTDADRISITAPGLAEEAHGLPRFSTANAALADAVLAVGFTARSRRANHRVLSLREFESKLKDTGPEEGRISLVFGREDSGLPNDVLGLCHCFVTIETAVVYRSLNLAQAVLLGCHAVRRASMAVSPKVTSSDSIDAATLAHVDGLMAHAAEVLELLEFFKFEGARDSILYKLRVLISRAKPTTAEVQLLRGICAETQRIVNEGSE